jgi:hypothetical protein
MEGDLPRDCGDLIVEVPVGRGGGGENQRGGDYRERCAEGEPPEPRRAVTRR